MSAHMDERLDCAERLLKGRRENSRSCTGPMHHSIDACRVPGDLRRKGSSAPRGRMDETQRRATLDHGVPPFLFHARPAGPEPMSANVVHAVHTESPVCHARAHFTRAFRSRNETRYDAASRGACNVLTNLCCGMQCGLLHHHAFLFRPSSNRRNTWYGYASHAFWVSKVHNIHQNTTEASFKFPSVQIPASPKHIFASRQSQNHSIKTRNVTRNLASREMQPKSKTALEPPHKNPLFVETRSIN